MTSVRVFSGALIGLEGLPIEVEVDATAGLHFFTIVGLPDKTVEESKDRIASAIRNSGFVAPKQKNLRIIVNLAPADVKKEGPGYDLPIALGYLLCTKQIAFDPKKTLCIGELSLDGSLRKLSGILPIVAMAKAQGFKEIIVPQENAAEASIIRDIRILPSRSLIETTAHLQGKSIIAPAQPLDFNAYLREKEGASEFDMDQIKGQESAKRALVIAASGGHNILMHGPPGSGKTILARALAGIMPAMDHDEAIEVTKIFSVSGLISQEPLIIRRPFRSPHHTTSAVAIVGGGSWPKPGEITLAHRGVLFLDEFPEFPRSVIEALRQPMEQGEVTISRASGSVRFPARFMLVAAMNPCPCGNFGNAQKACICNDASIARYQKKVSGPILDRIDIQINVSHETYDKLKSTAKTGPDPRTMRATIAATRERQRARFSTIGIATNSEMGPREIQQYCGLSDSAEQMMKKVMADHNLSGRGYHKILKLSRTIADIGNSAIIQLPHIAEAIGYRIKNEQL